MTRRQNMAGGLSLKYAVTKNILYIYTEQETVPFFLFT